MNDSEKVNWKNEVTLFYTNQIDKLEKIEKDLPKGSIKKFKNALHKELKKDLKAIDKL